jgi:hypothetical protein
MAVDGDWTITISTPMGPQDAKLSIATSGATFTGRIDGELIPDREIAGSVSGETVSWSMDIDKPMPLTLDVSLTANGDLLTGNAKLGMFGDAPVTGRR